MRLTPEQRARALALLRERRSNGQGGGTIEPSDRPGPYPLSYQQELLFMLHQLLPDSVAYNAPGARRFQGPLRVDALQHALDTVVARHESLRTRYLEVDGEPRQIVDPPAGAPLEQLDISTLDEQARARELDRLLRERSRAPFDLSGDTLLRPALIRLGRDDHVFLGVLHHIASDGWSRGILFRELAEVYGAALAARPPLLPKLPIQYRDYAQWQRRHLDDRALEQQLHYWRGALDGAPACLELPADRGRPAVQTFAGRRQARMMDPALRDAVRALARGEGVTVFMALVAAFAALLHRHSGQEQVVIGTPVAGRGRAEIAGLIGYFTNTLPIRLDLSDDPTFRQLLARARAAALGAFAHQEMPFSRLVAELAPQRDLSMTPIFQAMFVFQNAIGAPFDLPGLHGLPVRLAPGWSKFDLTLGMGEHEEGLNASWEYSSDLFDDATIARMVGQLERVLSAVVAAPETRISELELLGPQEREQIVRGFNPAPTTRPQRCIHELVAEQAARVPKNLAVVCGERSLTYAELEARASRLAHRLPALGVAPGAIVGVCLTPSLDLPVAILAALKAGAAYLPLDSDYPPDRLAAMVADSGTTAILTSTALVQRLPRGVRLLALDQPAQATAEPSEVPPQPGVPRQPVVPPDSLAYVIYTSGSSGRPKGVMVEHRSLVNHAQEMARHFGLTGEDRMLQFSSISFDISVEEMFTTWISGATLVLRDAAYPISGRAFLDALERDRISVLDLPTAFWHEWVGELDPPLPSTLRLVVVGGERARADAYREWLQKTRGAARWLNTYGPTEATVVATAWEPEDGQAAPREVPIGRPIGGVRVHIVDSSLRPVPVGVVGQLAIAGAGVARGYLGDPELTAQRFVPDVLGGGPGERMYLTGDLGRYQPDGAIQFVGRADEQLKVRGFRVEPGEIEAALEAHPAVKEAAVSAPRSGAGTASLLAFVVPKGGMAPSDRELRRFLRSKLPGYMVPSAVVTLEELPRTAAGKLDRRRLEHPAQPPEAPRRGYAAPRDEREAMLAGIWAELLGVERVGIHDDFFELGGHSLLAMRLAARVRDRLGVEFELRSLFEAPTVGELSARCHPAVLAAGPTPLPRNGAPPVAQLTPDKRA